MAVPSIKGSAFQSVVEDVKRLIDQGRVDPEEVATHLTEKDRGFLDTLVTPVSWLPIASYGRLLELLAREEGGADPQGYLARRGAQAAERLFAGSYAAFATSPGTWGPRVAQTMIGVSKLLYNFMEWSFDAVDEQVFEISCAQSEAYPEAARITAQGFLQWFSEHAAGRPMWVTSERRRPDLVVFRIAER